MRPRLITAENSDRYVQERIDIPGFNEAAAHHRGERRVAAEGVLDGVPASMRPRLITAENIRRRLDQRAEDAVASMRPRLITAENYRPAG